MSLLAGVLISRELDSGTFVVQHASSEHEKVVDRYARLSSGLFCTVRGDQSTSEHRRVREEKCFDRRIFHARLRDRGARSPCHHFDGVFRRRVVLRRAAFRERQHDGAPVKPRFLCQQPSLTVSMYSPDEFEKPHEFSDEDRLLQPPPDLRRTFRFQRNRHHRLEVHRTTLRQGREYKDVLNHREIAQSNQQVDSAASHVRANNELEMSLAGSPSRLQIRVLAHCTCC